MIGRVEAIYRYPVKGFSPESLAAANLAPGLGLAFDRAYAVEDGPSGFDPAAPRHIPKMRFTVLAKIPAVALARTRFDETTHVLTAAAPGTGAISAALNRADGRAAFARWLEIFLAARAIGPLQVIPGPAAHRFFDHPLGHVSLINLASVRDLEQRLGAPIDPLRFRANIYVDGWPAWRELEAREIVLGAARLKLFAPIARCVATHVDPQTGRADLDVMEGLRHHFGHVLFGAYLQVEQAGAVRSGDGADLA